MSQSCHNHWMPRRTKTFVAAISTTISIGAMMAAIALFPVAASAQGTQNPPTTPPTAPPPLLPGESSSKDPLVGVGSVPAPPPPTAPSKLAQPAPVTKDADNELPPLPAFNPLVAQKDIEVGTYYMKRGDVDAAIDRFHEATISYPTYALPWQLLGEAYEKKAELDDAIKAYQKYLKLYPRAPTRKKLEEHIAQLQSKQKSEPQKIAGK